MSKIVVLEWATRVTETHRAEVAFDRLPQALREAVSTGKMSRDGGVLIARNYLPDIEGEETLARSVVYKRDLYKWSAKDE